MALGRGGEGAHPAAAEADLVQPGPLIENMQAGLQKILDLRQSLAAINTRMRDAINGWANLDDVHESLEEAQQTLPDDLLGLFERKVALDASTYPVARLATVGYSAILLGAGEALIAREQQVWADSPVAQEWIGKRVTVLRPPHQQTHEEEAGQWGRYDPPYQAYTTSGCSNGNLGASVGLGGTASYSGVIENVSLKRDGTISLNFGKHRTGILIAELFEPINDPDHESKIVVPRVAIEAVTELPIDVERVV
jgi:hypothetical protein